MPQAGLKGRLPRKAPEDRYPLKWAHEYFTDLNLDVTYPVDRTEGVVLDMQDNDGWGDCAEAGEVHEEMVTAVAAGVSFTPDPHLALQRAKEFAGFPDTPPGPGSSLPDLLQKLFLAGVIKAWAPVDHTNRAQCIAIMSAGFGLYIGVNLYDENMDQFNAGQPLDVVEGRAPNPEEGHCVIWNASDALDADFDTIGTWAEWAKVTLAWMNACLHNNEGGEAYLIVTTEEQLAQFTPQLLEDIQALGGTGPSDQTQPPEKKKKKSKLKEIADDVEDVVEDVVHEAEKIEHNTIGRVFGRSANDVSQGPVPRV